NRGKEQGNDRERKQGELPIHSHHDYERPDKRDDRCENVGEALIVDGLNRLRIVGDAEAGVAGTAGGVVVQRKRLQVGVEIRAQFQQRLEPDFYEQVIAPEIEQAPEKLDHDQGEAEQENEPG